jgi:ribonuclease HII
LQQAIIKGDAKSASIAAASILAKVSPRHISNQLARTLLQFGLKLVASWRKGNLSRAVHGR